MDTLESGAKIDRGFMMYGDDYKFFQTLPGEGWTRVNTAQDASYHVTWINDQQLELASYCEGDTDITHCDNKEMYDNEVKRLNEWIKTL